MIDDTTSNSVSEENLKAAHELGRKYSKMDWEEFFLSEEYQNLVYPKLEKLSGFEDRSGRGKGRNFGEVVNAFMEGHNGY